MFFSKSTRGFYDPAIHGQRKLQIVDPDWVHPEIVIPDPDAIAPHILDPNWVRPVVNGVPDVAALQPLIIDPDWVHPQISVPDPEAVPSVVEIDNPACLMPADAREISDALYASLLEGQTAGKLITVDESGAPVLTDPPPPSAEQLTLQFTAAIQERLDAFAKTRNYDSILSACTYATSAVPKFLSEGQACVNLRDATWAAAYDILAKVQAGQRPMPASIEDIEADLPALVWP